jgi:hypothetical protein
MDVAQSLVCWIELIVYFLQMKSSESLRSQSCRHLCNVFGRIREVNVVDNLGLTTTPTFRLEH